MIILDLINSVGRHCMKKPKPDGLTIPTKGFNLVPVVDHKKGRLLWVERKDGEGTMVTYEKFDEYLEKLFEEVM